MYNTGQAKTKCMSQNYIIVFAAVGFHVIFSFKSLRSSEQVTNTHLHISEPLILCYAESEIQKDSLSRMQTFSAHRRFK